MCPLPRPLLLVQVTSEEGKGVAQSGMPFPQVHSCPVQTYQPPLLPRSPQDLSLWLESPSFRLVLRDQWAIPCPRSHGQ